MTSTSIQLKLHYIWFGIGYLLLLLVATVSLIPLTDDGGVSDKLMHFLTYLILSAWFSLLVTKVSSLFRIGVWLILFGIVIEILQGLTSYRSAELADAIANSLGIFTGLVFHFTPLRRVMRWVDASLCRLWQ